MGRSYLFHAFFGQSFTNGQKKKAPREIAVFGMRLRHAGHAMALSGMRHGSYFLTAFPDFLDFWLRSCPDHPCAPAHQAGAIFIQ